MARSLEDMSPKPAVKGSSIPLQQQRDTWESRDMIRLACIAIAPVDVFPLDSGRTWTARRSLDVVECNGLFPGRLVPSWQEFGGGDGADAEHGNCFVAAARYLGGLF